MMKRFKAIFASVMLIAALIMTSACSDKAEEKTVEEALSCDLTAVVAQFELGEDMLELNAEEIVTFYGITEDECVQCIAIINTSGVSSDEIILVEAKDEASADAVFEKVENRRLAKLNETENYFPAEHEKVETAEVKRSGNFVSLIISDDAENMMSVYENSFESK